MGLVKIWRHRKYIILITFYSRAALLFRYIELPGIDMMVIMSQVVYGAYFIILKLHCTVVQPYWVNSYHFEHEHRKEMYPFSVYFSNSDYARICSYLREMHATCVRWEV